MKFAGKSFERDRSYESIKNDIRLLFKMENGKTVMKGEMFETGKDVNV